jgi:hypothetical protein
MPARPPHPSRSVPPPCRAVRPEPERQLFRLGIICNRIAIPYVTLYTTFRGWDAVPNDRSREVGRMVSPRCPVPSTARRHAERAFPRRLSGPIALHCSRAVPFSPSMLDTRSAVPPRHPVRCLSQAAPHSNSTLTSQPVPAHAGIPQAEDRGPVRRDRCPTVLQHGSSSPCRLSQRRADDPLPTLDCVLLVHRRSGPPCGVWCPFRHAPTSTYVQRNCR